MAYFFGEKSQNIKLCEIIRDDKIFSFIISSNNVQFPDLGMNSHNFVKHESLAQYSCFSGVYYRMAHPKG